MAHHALAQFEGIYLLVAYHLHRGHFDSQIRFHHLERAIARLVAQQAVKDHVDQGACLGCRGIVGIEAAQISGILAHAQNLGLCDRCRGNGDLDFLYHFDFYFLYDFHFLFDNHRLDHGLRLGCGPTLDRENSQSQEHGEQRESRSFESHVFFSFYEYVCRPASKPACST